MGTRFINVDLIDPDPSQPRENKPVEYLRDDLALSIAFEGLNNPIHIRETSENPEKWWIVNGECRWTAVSMFVKGQWEKHKAKVEVDENGVITVNGVVLHGLRMIDGKFHIEASDKSHLKSNRAILKNQILDNHVRKNMDPVETLRSVQRLIDAGEPIQTAANALGTTPATLEKDLTILRLPDELLAIFDRGEMAKKVAHRLAELKSHQSMRNAWKWAVNAKNADGALAKIQAYENKVKQQDIFDMAIDAASDKDKRRAKKAYVSLHSAVTKFADMDFLSDDDKRRLILVANRGKVNEIKEVAARLQKIGALLISDIQDYTARSKSAVA